MQKVRAAAIVGAILAIAGCGTVDSIKNSDKTDFVLISHSAAGGAYKLIRGQTAACKLSMHGITGLIQAVFSINRNNQIPRKSVKARPKKGSLVLVSSYVWGLR